MMKELSMAATTTFKGTLASIRSTAVKDGSENKAILRCTDARKSEKNAAGEKSSSHFAAPRENNSEKKIHLSGACFEPVTLLEPAGHAPN
jgi:hypothetical protein